MSPSDIVLKSEGTLPENIAYERRAFNSGILSSIAESILLAILVLSVDFIVVPGVVLVYDISCK